jgi:hypothetical protein
LISLSMAMTCHNLANKNPPTAIKTQCCVRGYGSCWMYEHKVVYWYGINCYCCLAVNRELIIGQLTWWNWVGSGHVLFQVAVPAFGWRAGDKPVMCSLSSTQWNQLVLPHEPTCCMLLHAVKHKNTSYIHWRTTLLNQ